jgi:hypothetical protein
MEGGAPEYPVPSGAVPTVARMGRPDFPRTIVDFQERYSDEAVCLEYLADSRWPEGYHCPACGGEHAWVLHRRHL